MSLACIQREPWELNNMEWSEKPGIFLGWGASLATTVPAVADLIS